MQYREELVAAANDIYNGIENRKAKILNQIQLHAVNQIKSGYTGFRICRLSKSDESFLKEWADMTNATIKVIKFRCFEDTKRYIVKQFMVDLKDSMNLGYELEGNTLIIE